MLHADDQPAPSRVRRGWAGLEQMKTRSAVKWSALTMGGSVGAVAALIVIETLVRWLGVVVGLVWGLIP
jgi:hypothetical protein